MKNLRRRIVLGRTCAALLMLPMLGGAGAPPSDPPAVKPHIDRARAIAGSDLPRALEFCSGNKYVGKSYAENIDKWIAPVRVFDNLFYIGTLFVGTWIVNTSDGLILIDALGSNEDARDRLVPGLRQLGLDPAKIKYVIVTHGHWDHFGGAPYIARTFGAHIGLSAEDWALMPTLKPDSLQRLNRELPKKDWVITDGDTLTLGDTKISLYLTPGHSPGTLSMIVPARERANTYLLSLMGGTAFPAGLEPDEGRGGLLAHARSIHRLAQLSREAEATGILNTHISNDGSADRLQALAKRGPGDPHPFIIGERNVQRHYEILEECAKAEIARKQSLQK